MRNQPKPSRSLIFVFEQRVRISEVHQALASNDVLIAHDSSELVEDNLEACFIMTGGKGTSPWLSIPKGMVMMRLELRDGIPLNHLALDAETDGRDAIQYSSWWIN